MGKSVMLILLCVALFLSGGWAYAQDVQAPNALYNVALNQGVPAACMLALVINYIFIEGPRQRATLEKILNKVDGCAYRRDEHDKH